MRALRILGLGFLLILPHCAPMRSAKVRAPRPPDEAAGIVVESELEPGPAAAAELLRLWGDTLQQRGDWDAAAERYQKALALDRTKAPKSLAVARSLASLGIVAVKKGDHAAAEELLQQALAIREELAPGTSEVADSLDKLGFLARRLGDLTRAEKYLTQGEEIQRRLAPDSHLHARLLMSLGNLASDRGDLDRAESLHRQAHAIFATTAPESVDFVASLLQLADIAINRGDLAAAEDLLRRARELQERGARDELDVWLTWRLLGHLALERGELETAEAHYRQGLETAEKLDPDGLEAARSLASLGSLLNHLGDSATGRAYLRRAMEIEEKLVPESLLFAVVLENLGHVEWRLGHLDTTEELFRRALAIFEKAAPESLGTSIVLRDLGGVSVGRGRLQEAVEFHRRAAELQHRLAPGSSEEAETLYYLGQVELQAGQLQEGVRDFCRAADVIDRQRTMLGGVPEAKASFEAFLFDYYHQCLAGLIELGRPAEAFHTLERGRARSFLALLAERELRLAELPPELAAERERVNAEYDRVQSQLAPLSAGRDDAEIERLTGELRDLRTRQEEILARIRHESTRAGSLQDPTPLDLAGARAALDPGTVLLEYTVGEERTWLFVVQAAGAKGSGLSVFWIDKGTKNLHDEVESFRLLLKNPGSDLAELQAQARRLYDLLVRPAEAQIAGAQRILVSSHGPLHTLPFAALVRGDDYLIEWKPIHSALSATVYAELARSRKPLRERGEMRLAAFGDPVYPSPTSAAPADPDVREAINRGLVLTPLPFSSREVKDIAAMFPQAQIYLGRDATEEKARAIAPEMGLVHFACHGVLDERFPLNSALALTLPEQPSEGQENGLLQAWEIFESVRLDADLVTLSACDTALGEEMGGEGLVGLTRAFQYAGARSVLASLWGVADRSTARFMKSFYGHLHSGKTKDEALRAAQIDQIRGDGFSHPFHWAAFQLTGDWQ